MARDKYTLTTRSVAAQPRSKRRAASAAAGTGGTAADIDLSGYLTVAEVPGGTFYDEEFACFDLFSHFV